MASNETHQDIEYKPSVAGRVAKYLIPFLQKNLPPKIYRFVYDRLYGGYKMALKLSYGVRTLSAKFLGGPEEKLRTSLTWKLFSYSMGGKKALENAFEVTALAEKRKIQGALVECGVAEGGTAAMMALVNKELGTIARAKWFFDSFEGLPEPTAEDYEGGRTGNFIRPLPKGSCLGTVEQVKGLMCNKLSVPEEEVHLVKGWFQDTVPKMKNEIGAIAVLRLDGDWYESTKVPLENLYDQISPGGFVIVDDYATCFGSRKAVDEFRSIQNISSPLYSDGRGGVWFQKSGSE